ncbi:MULTISPECIES: NADH-quinone oxidoreductase subunit J family protein [Thermodesulfovibrio]|jgi:NADH-quinone oxidoreductase subunit J|uniref:NADH-quinone oxidoreductase subunit J family protein n=1 Tax=Thermodesulfovibrio TaxID=28261 RepID=UPI0026245743|nr:NADH-quinone oxidoreductase subunit J [Thermodesulfovibrio sp.]
MNQTAVDQAFFIYFYLSLSILSIAVIVSKNIIHSAFFLLIFLLHVAAVFLFLNSEFLMVIQIIVYVGGVLALFVFAIMVMNIKEELKHRRFVRFAGAGILVSLLFFAVFYGFVKNVKVSSNPPPPNDVNLLGSLLYSYYLLPFEILSVVLLIALVAGIIIARKSPREEK